MRDDIKGVAFDLDGTLYPNYRFNIRLLPFILKEWRLLTAFGKARTIIRKEQKESLKNGSQPDQIFASAHNVDFYTYQSEITAKILSAKADVTKEKIEKLIYKGWEPLFKKVKLFKGARELLDALKKAGFKLGMLSDFPPETKLGYLGIDKYWDSVLCSERYGSLKPHPISFLRLAKDMSLPPENILYVGNSLSYDIEGAASAGMKTAWLKPLPCSGSGKNKPVSDFSFTNYRQLYKFLLL